MKLHFLLLQDYERDQHARFAMALLITKGTSLLSSMRRPTNECSFNYAINEGCGEFALEAGTYIEDRYYA